MKTTKIFKKIGTSLFLGFLLLAFSFFNYVNAAILDFERVDPTTTNITANGASSSASISDDGNYIFFISAASDLVAGDTNGVSDLFMYDTQTEDLSIISVDSSGTPTNSSVDYFSHSSDGRYVVFSSGATNLVAGDTNDVPDIFLHDTQTGTTTRVSVDSLGNESDNASYYVGGISDDGRFISFHSTATNLVAGDTNGVDDIFLHDTQTGTTTRVSVDSLGGEGNDYSDFSVISDDGLYVAFTSAATNLVAGDTNGQADVFLHDTQTGTTTRVSVDSLGGEGNDYSGLGGMSSDGRYISFYSYSTNLVAGDTNGQADVFLHDTQTGTTTRVSVDSLGDESDGPSSTSNVSSDGRYVTFISEAPSLDVNIPYDLYQQNLYIHDTQTSETSIVFNGNNPSYLGYSANSVTSDGVYLAFSSASTNVIDYDNNSESDVFIYNTQTSDIDAISLTNNPQTTVFQVNGAPTYSKISGDGRYVAFSSQASNIVPNDTNGDYDIFLYDTQTGATTRVSVDSLGNEIGGSASVLSISYNGRYIAFASEYPIVSDDTNGELDYYVHDTQTGTTTRVSVDSLGDEGVGGAPIPVVRISQNGRYVVFLTHSDFDSEGLGGYFLHDTQTGTTIRVSLGITGNPVNAIVNSISSDGRYLTLASSDIENLGDGDGSTYQIFLRDIQLNTTIIASKDSSGVLGNSVSGNSVVSEDGRYVFFDSNSSNLVANDINGQVDVFVHDTQTGETSKISQNGTVGGSGLSFGDFNSEMILSTDNNYLFYNNVLSGDYIFDLENNVYSPIGSLGSMSNVGKKIVTKSSSALVTPDTNGVADLFFSPFAFVEINYSGNFTESSSNNGSVDGSRIISITEDTFANPGGTLTLNTHYTLTNAPAGLTPVMTISGDGLTATLTFSGNATSHINSDDVSNLTITLLDDAFVLESDANQVIGNGNSEGTIDFIDPSNPGGSGSNPNPVRGCTDSDANNYNPNATQDNGSCLYEPGAINGCTDETAGNYDDRATVDDGSCVYGVFGCMDLSATNYDPSAEYSNNSCIYAPIDPPSGPNDTPGCTNPSANNYNPSATQDNGSCEYDFNPTSGCTDASAQNFNPNANQDDGSCSYDQTNPPLNPSDPTNPNGGSGGNGGLNSLVNSVSGFIKDNPEILIPVSVVGVVSPYIPSILGNIAGIISIPIRIWNIIPTLLGFRRRKRPWGTVFDSVTKQPLDPVYVMLKDSFGKEISTSITDLDGRYGFQVPAGQYSIFANKANYTFPSAKLAGKTEDELYHDLYFGETLSVEKDGEVIQKNIPMDAQNFNWNEFEKSKNKKLMKFYSSTELFLARISKVLFFAGLVASVLLTIIDPRTFNLIILGLYIVILVLAFFGIKPRASGFVNEKGTGFPLSFGIISVFSAELGREVAHTIIGKTGKYYLLVPKGNYFLKIRKKTGEDSYEDLYQSESFVVKKGYINRVIKV